LRRTVLIIPLFLFLASPLYAWVIKDYQVDVQVAKKGFIEVTERIQVDFGQERHHGIYRTIPLTFKDPMGEKHRLRIKGIYVTDDMVRPLKVRKRWSSKQLYLRIGDPKKLVTGVQNYIISYRVWRVLYQLNDVQELYWNAVGTGWAVPVEKASVTVLLPFSGQGIHASCYVGSWGSKSKDCAWQQIDGELDFTADHKLGPHEGLTVAVGWPKGMVEVSGGPGWWASPWFTVVLFLVILFALLYWLWWTRGRDVGGRGVIQVQYRPPESMTPLEAGILIDEKMDMRDVVAEIVDLARRGYLTIEEVEHEGLLWGKKRDYIFHKKDGALDLHDAPYDITLIAALFPSGNTQKLSDLKKKFYSHIPTLKSQVFSVMRKKHYFSNDPSQVRNIYNILASAVFFASFFFGRFLSLLIMSDPQWTKPIVLGGVASALMIFLFGRIMPRKTAKGRLTWEHLKGYEEFISRVEKDVIEKLFSPEEIPRIFEETLPFAIAFGEAERWSSAFSGLFEEPPRWYVTSGTYTPIYLGHSMDHFSREASVVLASAPRSSGGASFGGGFAGGGGGGGGGGAW